MNEQNFDANDVSNYPLTIDRMKEMQGDLQVPLKILSGAAPLGNCILSGCENAGDPGYVIMGWPDGNGGVNYEVIEVRESNISQELRSLCRYLTPLTTFIRAQNSDLENVIVRTEQVLQWEIATPTGMSSYLDYKYLPRLRLEKRAQDDPAWVMCTVGGLWFAPTGGHLLRVQRVGGKVHMSCHMQCGLNVSGNSYVVSGSIGDATVVGGVTVTADMTEVEIPARYRPEGDLAIPVRYNGNAAFGILNSSGNILLPNSVALGDILQIDTWLDI